MPMVQLRDPVLPSDFGQGTAVQMAGPFVYDGIRYPPGYWVVMFPHRRDVHRPESFQRRFHVVTDL